MENYFIRKRQRGKEDYPSYKNKKMKYFQNIEMMIMTKI